MKFAFLSAIRLPLIGAIGLCAYVLLDRYSDAGGFGTAWQPSTGLAFALALLYGRKMLPLLFCAPFLSEIVNPGLARLRRFERL